MKCLSVFISIYFLSTVCLFSQISLRGKVTDNGGEYLGGGAEPVENALVTVIDQANPARYFSDYTDDRGVYIIKITPTDVDDGSAIKPGDFRLLQNYPNPFNPSTVIGYQLPCPSHIRLEIYDLLGRKIKTLLDGFESSGFGQVIWDATNDLNQGVSAGLYIYSLQVGGVRINKKMLLIDGNQGGSSFAISKAMKKDGAMQRVLSKTVSDQYLVMVTGENIETYVQSDLMIIENTGLVLTVCRTVTDIDGNTYRTVKIGNQCWMAENLKVTHYRNGNLIRKVTDNSLWRSLSTDAYCDYDNDESNVETYGRLYNWYAVNDSRNIAPEGWHIPKDAEWQTLEDYLGGLSVAGGKMKSTGTIEGGNGLWYEPNEGATNESGFSTLPGGCRDYSSGTFDYVGAVAFFWSSTEYSSSRAWHRYLGCGSSHVYCSNYDMQAGFSVRCVRD